MHINILRLSLFLITIFLKHSSTWQSLLRLNRVKNPIAESYHSYQKLEDWSDLPQMIGRLDPENPKISKARWYSETIRGLQLIDQNALDFVTQNNQRDCKTAASSDWWEEVTYTNDAWSNSRLAVKQSYAAWKSLENHQPAQAYNQMVEASLFQSAAHRSRSWLLTNAYPDLDLTNDRQYRNSLEDLIAIKHRLGFKPKKD